MNFVIQSKQPAPSIYSRSCRIIAVTSVVVIITFIVAMIIQCIDSWHINFISDLTIAACALAHLCWVVSTVNMLLQKTSKWIIRLSQTALIAPNLILVVMKLAMCLFVTVDSPYRHELTNNEVIAAIFYILAFMPPIIAWFTNTILVIRSMIKTHQHLKS